MSKIGREGMLWYCIGRHTLIENVALAKTHYTAKTGHPPRWCDVYAGALGLEGARQAHTDLTIIESRAIPPGHLWIGHEFEQPAATPV